MFRSLLNSDWSRVIYFMSIFCTAGEFGVGIAFFHAFIGFDDFAVLDDWVRMAVRRGVRGDGVAGCLCPLLEEFAGEL